MNGELMDIGTVAAANIARALELGEDKVNVIRSAIRDEITAMSSHFTLAVADMQTSHELDLEKLKRQYADQVEEIRSTASFVNDNVGLVLTALGLTFLFGAAVGLVL